jgi:branched-subunit amino acid transport protein
VSVDAVIYLYVTVVAILGALIAPILLPVLGANHAQSIGCSVTLGIAAIVMAFQAMRTR